MGDGEWKIGICTGNKRANASKLSEHEKAVHWLTQMKRSGHAVDGVMMKELACANIVRTLAKEAGRVNAEQNNRINLECVA